MNQEKQKRILIAVAYYGVILLGVYFGFRFLIPPLMPFLIGFCVAWILRRPTVLLAAKLRIPQKVSAVFLTAIFYLFAAAIILLVGWQLISALKEIIPQLPEIYTNQLLPFLNHFLDGIKEFTNQIDPSIAEDIDVWAANASSSTIQTLTSFSGTILKSVSSVAAGTPMMILRTVLTIISTFYIAIDFDRIVGFLEKLLPEKAKKVLNSAKEKTVHFLKVFLRSYCLIFLMTFVELSTGFFIMKIPYAIGVGLLVAVIDIMPVLGTGLVLLPWAVIALFMKNIPLAIGMVLLYIIMTAIRNIVEPKLVGQQIGLHPLATLISMFLGLQLFGVIGLFAFPVLLSLLVQFRRDGILQLPYWGKNKAINILEIILKQIANKCLIYYH